MSFAGFAGLIGALRTRGSGWGSDGPTVFRLSAAALAAFNVTEAARGLRSGRRIRREMPELQRRSLVFIFVAVPAVIVLPLAIYTGRLELYELSLLVTLLSPILIFSFVLEGLRRNP